MAYVKKEKVNEIVVCGELIDFINDKSGTTSTGNPYFRYTMRIETNKETKETHDVEFMEFATMFDGKENPRYKAMCTAFEEYRSRVTDGVGEVVRVTGKLVTNSYVSKNEKAIVNKLVLKGERMHRDRGDEKEHEEGKFDFCAKFEGIGFIDKVEEVDGKLVVSTLINEYKSKNKGAVGHLIDMYVTNPDMIEGAKDYLQVDDVVTIGALLVDMVETKFLPESETKELEKRKVSGFGTGIQKAKEYNEWVEKENARRKKLREEGLQIHKESLELTGADLKLDEDFITEGNYPFEKDDINDMLDGVYKIQDDLQAELNMLNINNSDVPF
jgi:hypothetical protein